MLLRTGKNRNQDPQVFHKHSVASILLFYAGLPTVKKKQSTKKKRGYWYDIDNRRKFFCEFAEEMDFDPYKPDNWTNITYAKIAEKKVCRHTESH